MASSHCGIPSSTPRWSRIFSLLWIGLAISPECEGSIPPSGFYGRLPVKKVKLACTALSSQRCESLLRSDVGRDRVGYYLQEWKWQEILG